MRRASGLTGTKESALGFRIVRCHASQCVRCVPASILLSRLATVSDCKRSSVADPKSAQKHVWRARIILKTDEGLGTWCCRRSCARPASPRPACGAGRSGSCTRVPVESELVGQSVRAVRVAVPVVVVPRLVVEVALAPVAVFVPLLPAPHRPLFVPPERRPAPYLPVVEDRPFNACAGSLTQ